MLLDFEPFASPGWPARSSITKINEAGCVCLFSFGGGGGGFGSDQNLIVRRDGTHQWDRQVYGLSPIPLVVFSSVLQARPPTQTS